MKTMYHLVIIVAFLIVGQSCSENKANSESNSVAPPVAVQAAPTSDTLQFVSAIRCILHDSKGNYWIGSDEEGVCRYDGNRFQYYSLQNGLPGNQVFSVKEDKAGIIWIRTNQGICSFDGTRITSGPVFQSLESDDFPQIWIEPGESNDRLNLQQQFITLLKQHPKAAMLKNPHSVSHGISFGTKGNLWLGCYDMVWGFNGKEISLINDSTLRLDGKKKYLHVRSLLEDSKGRLWIGNNGIGVLLKEGNSIFNFSEKQGLADPNGSAFENPSAPGTLKHVFAIFEDSRGNIWFGDRDTGAWRFDGKEIKNIPCEPSPASLHIWQIYEDKKGNLLFAMGAGVYQFRGTKLERFF